ncbi:MAG: hypothetical protein ACI4VH_06860 [Clostridia bacterium]
MLSKEEIKKDIKQLRNISECFTYSMWSEDTETLRRILNYIEQLESDKQKLIEKLEKKIRYFEENDEFIATSNDNYSDGTVIKRFIDEFKDILQIVKG